MVVGEGISEVLLRENICHGMSEFDSFTQKLSHERLQRLPDYCLAERTEGGVRGALSLPGLPARAAGHKVIAREA